jgi:hypothetical protein
MLSSHFHSSSVIIRQTTPTLKLIISQPKWHFNTQINNLFILIKSLKEKAALVFDPRQL